MFLSPEELERLRDAETHAYPSPVPTDVRDAMKAADGDKLAALKKEYEAAGTDRSNLAYGFIDKKI